MLKPIQAKCLRLSRNPGSLLNFKTARTSFTQQLDTNTLSLPDSKDCGSTHEAT